MSLPEAQAAAIDQPWTDLATCCADAPPTRDVLVSPAVFTIPANGSQIVRVALRRAAGSACRSSFPLGVSGQAGSCTKALGSM